MFDRIDLIDEAVLNVDAARIGAGQIAHQLFVGRRVLKRIPGDEIEQALGLGFEIRGRDFPGVLLGLFRVNDRPTHQPGFLKVLLSGTAMPLRMDSRMPRMETR